jgi:hypothetical protein
LQGFCLPSLGAGVRSITHSSGHRRNETQAWSVNPALAWKDGNINSKRAQRALMLLLALFASRGLCNSNSIMAESGVGVCGRGVGSGMWEWPECRKSTRSSRMLPTEPDN